MPNAGSVTRGMVPKMSSAPLATALAIIPLNMESVLAS